MRDRSAVGLYGENIMKIAVIGYSGAGKSTLAGMLGEKYALPVLHLDRLNYSPGWVERPKEAGAAEVGEFLDANPSGWVIDGNYSRWHYERRMEEADRIILLDYNRIFCFFSALGRYRKYKNRTRPDMADGCDEKFDLDFALWILWKGHGRKQRDRHDMLEKKYGDKFIRIRSRRRLNKMLREGRI